MKKVLHIVAAVLAAGIVAVFAFGPGYLECSFNQVLGHEPYTIPAPVQVLHDDLVIADLHADTNARNP